MNWETKRTNKEQTKTESEGVHVSVCVCVYLVLVRGGVWLFIHTTMGWREMKTRNQKKNIIQKRSSIAREEGKKRTQFIFVSTVRFLWISYAMLECSFVCTRRNIIKRRDRFGNKERAHEANKHSSEWTFGPFRSSSCICSSGQHKRFACVWVLRVTTTRTNVFSSWNFEELALWHRQFHSIADGFDIWPKFHSILVFRKSVVSINKSIRTRFTF